MLNGPLAGFTVLDLSRFVAGPMASLILAEQGADVIKIEPVGGESFRRSGATKQAVGAWWYSTNRGKRSVAIDLKHEVGAQIVDRLLPRVDVLLHNFRGGVADRLGLGWDAVQERNPRIVYATMNGFGTKGPLAGRRAYDNIIQAFSGIQATQGGAGDPQSIRTPISDKIGPLLLAQAITAALLERERSGRGQLLETSMLHSSLWWMWADMLMNDTFLDDDGTVSRGDGPRDYNNIAFPTRDGYVTTGASTPAEFVALASALDRPDWLTDPQLASQDWRNENRTEFFDRIAAELLNFTTDDLLDRFAASDAQGARVNDPAEVPDHEQVVANDMVVVLNDPRLGRIRQPTPAVTFSRTPVTAQLAPRPGEHTREVLRSLGYGDSEIAEFTAGGIVGAPD